MNTTLASTVSAGIAHALGLIRSRYEGNSDPENDMPFHCAAHTEGVIRRAGSLLRAMGASETEYQLGLLAAAYHDTVQRWEANAMPDGRVLRKRFTGQNEAESAAEGVAWMQQHGGGVFQPGDAELLTQAIMATVPGWDPANGTVSQPNLSADSPAVLRAVAMSDLGIPGMDGGFYVTTGDHLFREENLDIARAFRRCASRSDLDASVLEGYKTRMLNWCRGQVSFAKGRRARLPIELGNLSGSARSAVEALFSRFDEAISSNEQAAKTREAMSPWEVAGAMGYTIPRA